MMDVGFSKTEIGIIVKALFTVSALGGLGARRCAHGAARPAALDAASSGSLQAVSNLLYCVLALAGKSYAIMVAAVVVEHVAGGDGQHRAGRPHHGAV